MSEISLQVRQMLFEDRLKQLLNRGPLLQINNIDLLGKIPVCVPGHTQTVCKQRVLF